MQSKKHSAIEAIVNTLAGLVLNIAIWYVILIPVFGMEMQVEEVVEANILITLAAVAKAYVIRRLFNRKAKVTL